MTTRMAWSCMRCSSNFTHFNTFMKQLLISIFPLACYKSFWVSPYYLNIDFWKNLDLAWSRFLVFSTLFCCVGFIYKTRVELLVSCLASRTSIRWSFHFLILSYFANMYFYNIYSCFWLHAAWDWCIARHDNCIRLLRNCKFTVPSNFVTWTLRFDMVNYL